MSYHETGAGWPDDAVCRYAGSNLWFRGPQRALGEHYIACVGGVETFGRYVERPFPVILQDRLNMTCVNFGSLHCGVEALLRDRGLSDLMNASRFCILQLPEVSGQSNRFYRVHPRRNDRFLEPTPELLRLYPEVDFTEVHFVRHLLQRLRIVGEDRFEQVVQELRESWIGSLRRVLRGIAPDVLLLWLRVLHGSRSDCEPIPIDRAMVTQLRPDCAGIVEKTVQASGESDDFEDLLFATLQRPVAGFMLGPAAHRSIADALRSDLPDLH